MAEHSSLRASSACLIPRRSRRAVICDTHSGDASRFVFPFICRSMILPVRVSSLLTTWDAFSCVAASKTCLIKSSMELLPQAADPSPPGYGSLMKGLNVAPVCVVFRPISMSSHCHIKARARTASTASIVRTEDHSESIGELLGCVIDFHSSHLRARDCKRNTGNNDNPQNRNWR
jgi:hypothetical protein